MASARRSPLFAWRRRRPPPFREGRLATSLLGDPGACPAAWPASPEPGTVPHGAEPLAVPHGAEPLVRVPQHAAPPPPLDIWAVEQSLDALTAGAQELAGTFYGYLFAACPELRDLFPAMMTVQYDRLFAALVHIVSLLGRPDRLSRYLTQLGRDHLKYGVQPEMYGPVGDALLRTLRQHSDEWGDRAEAAWAGAYTAAADTMIAGAGTWSGPSWWRGRVLGHEMRSDVALLEIRTGEPYPFEPGQYCTLQHPKWRNVWRSYSIAAPPAREGDLLKLQVRPVTGGWVSTALARDTPDDSEVLIGPAVGTMTAEAAGGRDLLLIAGGVGLAPLEALARDVLARDEVAQAGGWGQRREITLFHGSRTRQGLYQMPELRDLERSFPWFDVVPVVSGDDGFSGLRGSVSQAAAGYGNWMDREAYLAGPPAMITDARDRLRAAGVPAGQVHYDEAAAG